MGIFVVLIAMGVRPDAIVLICILCVALWESAWSVHDMIYLGK